MKRHSILVPLLLGLRVIPTVNAQPPRGEGPWNHDLLILESADGLRFGQPRVFVERGGVPSVLRDKMGRLVVAFQWFPFERPEAFDRVAVMLSSDEGKTWSKPQPVVIRELPGNFVRPCDPTLALLEDGRIRLYFTSDPRDGKGAGTYSAASSDGVNYTFEPGARFRVEGEMVLDCAVARLGQTWHYYAPVQGPRSRGYHAVSEDGLRFTRLPDVTMPGDRRWLGCVVPTKEGLRFYGSGQDGIWSAVSRDGSTWQPEDGSRAMGGDPGVVETRGGRYLMIVTGGPRPDAMATFAPPGQLAMTVGSDFLYILRDGVLYQYDPKDLRLIRKIRLTVREP